MSNANQSWYNININALNFAVLLSSQNKGHANIKGFTVLIFSFLFRTIFTELVTNLSKLKLYDLVKHFLYKT